MDVHASPTWLERDDGSTLALPPSLSVGRAPTNQLVLADEKVSRKHALIHRQDDGEYWLVDLGSSNGTYVDGRRVTQPVALRDGAVVRFGGSSLTFRRASTPAGPDAEAAWTDGTVTDIRLASCWLLLADIVGSTELSRSLPGEQLPIVVGRWFSECRQAIEAHGGAINKYLGDGFFAYWQSDFTSTDSVVAALSALSRLQSAGSPRFRIVVHHGMVSMGGSPSMGEESLSGPEVNFAFRMEKLAGALGYPALISQAAHGQLGDALAMQPAGRHPLPSFEGQFEFYAL